MTVTLSATRQTFARLDLAASLLGVALLIGSVQSSPAAEITPTPVSAPLSQMPAASPPAPATSTQDKSPALGTVGFGWG
jgi:hypothetical protein